MTREGKGVCVNECGTYVQLVIQTLNSSPMNHFINLTVPRFVNAPNHPIKFLYCSRLSSNSGFLFSCNIYTKEQAFTRSRSSFSFPGDDRDESISEM